MNGKAFGSALAAAAVSVALLAPAGLAAGPQGKLPAGFQTDTVNSSQVARGSYALDPWLKAAIAAHRAATSYSLPAGFQTDTANSARVARGAGVTYGLPAGFQTDTVNSARVQPAVELVTVGGGFDWSSFGIGIGAGIGVLAGIGALASRAGRLRRLASA